MLAHRVAYEDLVGPIPDDLCLDHTCHTTACVLGNNCPHRRCVNPAHLEPVTSEVNARRGLTGRVGGAKRGAQLRAKTHCPAGHEYDAPNTRWTPVGGRVCRRCVREKQRERRAGHV